MLKPKNISRIIFFTAFAASFLLLPYLIKATEDKPEDKLRLEFYRYIKPVLPIEKDRLIICDCAVKKIKARYAEVSPKKKEGIFKTAEKACYAEHSGLTFGWNDTLREMLRKQIFQNARFGNMDSLQKISYLNCFISTMKMSYPEGMNDRIPEKEMQTACVSCYHLLASIKMQPQR